MKTYVNDSIIVNGILLHRESLLLGKQAPLLPHLSARVQLELLDFLKELWEHSPTLRLQSSGSTGAPKQFSAPKKSLRASAQRSCDYLRLSRGQRVLLRLPLNYIAAKMMIIRCLVAGLELELRDAQSQLFDETIGAEARFDFSAVVAQQAVKSSLAELQRIDTLLLGGGFVPEALELKLREHTGRVYASYGMTETYSHIALRRLNGESASLYYTPMAGVELRRDEVGCLIISDPAIGVEDLRTNDLVEIHEDGSFLVTGRRDNTINSGGIKIQSESVEQRLRDATGLDCALLPRVHAELGQCGVLLWAGEPEDEARLQRAIQEVLTPYERPKQMQRSDTALPCTASHKLDRRACQARLDALLGLADSP